MFVPYSHNPRYFDNKGPVIVEEAEHEKTFQISCPLITEISFTLKSFCYNMIMSDQPSS